MTQEGSIPRDGVVSTAAEPMRDTWPGAVGRCEQGQPPPTEETSDLVRNAHRTRLLFEGCVVVLTCRRNGYGAGQQHGGID